MAAGTGLLCMVAKTVQKTSSLASQTRSVTVRTVKPTCSKAGYTLTQNERQTGKQVQTVREVVDQASGKVISSKVVATKDTWGRWTKIGAPRQTNRVAAGAGLVCRAPVTQPQTQNSGARRRTYTQRAPPRVR